MPSNSAQYQSDYRKKNSHKKRVVSVAMSQDDHAEFLYYAKSQNLSMSALLREATLHQLRGSQLKSKALEEELKELRFLISNIGNNINQVARHSNRVKHLIDEQGLLNELMKLQKTVDDFTNSRLKEPL